MSSRASSFVHSRHPISKHPHVETPTPTHNKKQTTTSTHIHSPSCPTLPDGKTRCPPPPQATPCAIRAGRRAPHRRSRPTGGICACSKSKFRSFGLAGERRVRSWTWSSMVRTTGGVGEPRQLDLQQPTLPRKGQRGRSACLL